MPAFSRDIAAFMPFWHPEVPQLAGVALEGLKIEPMTMTDPIRPPWRRSAGPGPSRSVTNVHEEQANSSRKQPVLLARGAAERALSVGDLEGEVAPEKCKG